MGPVLVTGATGFLGGAAARALVRAGVAVRATGRSLAAGSVLQREGIAFVPCDLPAEEAALDRLVEGCEGVIHAAALSAPWGRRRDFERINVRGTEKVIAACRRAGVGRLVHVSSPSVNFAFRHQSGLREETRWTEAPANPYIATKREAERLADGQTINGPAESLVDPERAGSEAARRGVGELDLGDVANHLDVEGLGDLQRLRIERADRPTGIGAKELAASNRSGNRNCCDGARGKSSSRMRRKRGERSGGGTHGAIVARPRVLSNAP